MPCLRYWLLACLFARVALCGAGEVTVNSKPVITCDQENTGQAWVNWAYSSDTHDYSGNALPDDFTLVNGVGCRKGYRPRASSDIVALLLVGNTPSDNVPFVAKQAYRSRLVESDIRAFFTLVSSIAGAYFENGGLFLVGKKNTRPPRGPLMLPEDIIVAARSVVNSPYHGASVMLERAENAGDAGKCALVAFNGIVENSHVGQVLFESDRLLKVISLGCDNITHKPLEIAREWHKNKFVFMKPSASAQEEWCRFWFLVENMKIFTDNDANVLKFETDDIVVRPQKVNESGGRRELYFENSGKTETGAFAKNFTDNFNSYKEYFPVLNEFVEIAKVVAIMRWLYNKGVIIKFEKNDVENFYTRFTPQKTPIIYISIKRVIRNIDLKRYEETEFRLNSKGGAEVSNFKYKEKGLEKFKKSLQNNPDYFVFKLL